MFDINQEGAARYPDLVRAGERSRATMTAHLRDLAAAGRLKGDPDLIGHLYWAALHGPLMLHFSGLLSPDQDARSLINALVTALGQYDIRWRDRPGSRAGVARDKHGGNLRPDDLSPAQQRL